MKGSRNATSVAGFPRIGENRELKKSLEQYWKGAVGADELVRMGEQLRARHWNLQREAGIGFISCNDFSFYDSMLDMAVMLDAIPERFRKIENDLDRYFAMARGCNDAAAMEMTKWFNTNYHYIVPELSAETVFGLNFGKIEREYFEALALGVETKINVIGPVTFLLLSKRTDGGDTLELLPKLMPSYIDLVKRVAKMGKGIVVQFDETALVRDPDARALECLVTVYAELCSIAGDDVRLLVFTAFDHAKELVHALRDVPLFGIGLDFVHGPENIGALADLNGKTLFAGVVDGRNIWKNHYRTTLTLLEDISQKAGRRKTVIGTSCSLLHVPFSLRGEKHLDSEILSWMSFANEKLEELADLEELFFSAACDAARMKRYAANDEAHESRASSSKTNDARVRAAIESAPCRERQDAFEARNHLQRKRLDLPFLPTTTIGSFPQTEELRKLRRNYKDGTIPKNEYDRGIRAYIDECVAFQEEIGLDVLVHGEPERNDMVEYFGEQLSGFTFTSNGWVQSYGSRCVKPPVIFGDVSRPKPMTVETITYAQSCTKKTMKGMLTGPVTILNWSFVRNDIPRSAVCEQIALAIRDEIDDLQNAGIAIVQVDEAAFREGYPLRRSKAAGYERWAVDSFKLAVSAARPDTQIHTHMCYSDFNGIMHTIEAMDADVISIETSRAGNKLLDVFEKHGYKNEIGPGVYDIHSPRVPSEREMEDQIRALCRILPPSKLWINPDCGLKTRKWEEVKPSLVNLVGAVRKVRKEL